jgi:hypothetical protein
MARLQCRDDAIYGRLGSVYRGDDRSNATAVLNLETIQCPGIIGYFSGSEILVEVIDHLGQGNT